MIADPLHTREFSRCAKTIPHGALLLWRARRWHPVDRLVSSVSRSRYCHAAMAAWDDRNRLNSLEMLQVRGGVIHPLGHYAKEYPGRIDVYYPNFLRLYQHYDPSAAVGAMQGVVSREGYGYFSLGRTTMAHMAGVRLLIPPNYTDAANGSHAPFCSEAVARAYRAGGVDVVPRLPDYLVEPGHLERSMFFEYMFTLV